MTHTRGQAALEFLTTYGWAFLVILVMIGALAYFGVINPNKFLPERCTFQQEITCKDFKASYVDTTHATVQLYVTNNLGNGMTAVTLSAKQTDGTAWTQCTPAVTSINAGDSLGFNCTGIASTYPNPGTKTKFQVNGTYTAVGGQYPHTVQGEIFATLQ